VAGRVRKSGSNLQNCLATPRSGSLIAYSSGHWIGSAERAWRRPSCIFSNELIRNILLALLSSLAKVETQKISERTRAGMSRARAKGIKIGRPKLTVELRHEITRRATRGETAYAIAKALHIDRHTAAKYLQS
jgi:hypothetical protein